MNKGLLIGILVVIALLVIVVASSGFFKQGKAIQEIKKETESIATQPRLPDETSIEQPQSTPVQTTPTQLAQPIQEVKEFSLTARKWSFEPSTITVKPGDKVKLKIISVDVTHGFTLREFGINTVLSPSKTIEAEFVADKSGTFTFFCSVPCGVGHTGMNGKLIVE